MQIMADYIKVYLNYNRLKQVKLDY